MKYSSMKKKKIKILFFGLGSIGQRYLRILKKKYNNQIKIYAYRKIKKTPFLDDKNKTLSKNIEKYYNIQNIKIREINSINPDIVFITNPSSMHVDTIRKMKSLKNTYIFVEKPIDIDVKKAVKILPLTKKNNFKIFYSSNLRFCDDFIYLKKIINKYQMGQIYYNIIKYSQDLKSYHPYENYKTSYTSKKSLGGGINFTSIHEIDLIINLFQKTKKLSSIIENIALKNLDIKDLFFGVYQSRYRKSKILSFVILDHFQKSTERYFKLICEKGEIIWDIKNNQIVIDKKNKKVFKKFKKDKNIMFENQIKFFFNLFRKKKNIPVNHSIFNGIECLKLSN